MKISVIYSSRENPKNLIESLDSYIGKCSSDNEVELLIGLDDNDDTRHSVIDYYKNVSQVKFYIRPQVGYFKLQRSFNYMAADATGDVFWFSSDKTTVRTENWDKFIEPYAKKFFVGGQKINWIEEGSSHVRVEMLCPIVSRLWFDVLNLIVNHTHVDSEIGHTLGKLALYEKGKEILPKLYKNFEIEVDHDRRKSPGFYKSGESHFFLPCWEKVRETNAGVLNDFLIRHPECIPD